MNAAVQAVRHLGIDRAETHQTTEGGLNVAAGAAEPIIEIEVTERGVEIVAPHQRHNAAAEPDAFGIARRTIDGLCGFGEFVALALAVPGGSFGGAGRIGVLLRRLGRLVLRPEVAALRNRAADAKQQRQSRHRQCPQRRISELNQSLTHTVPDIDARPWQTHCPDAAQIGPHCGGGQSGI